jgi:ribosomal protein S18 acetylase RimI-like enzyme
MQIREAKPEDAPAIARVHVESWKTTYPGIVAQETLDGLRIENGVALWQKHLATNETIVFVAEDEAGLFGFAAGGAAIHPVEGFDGEMSAIYLLASHQKRGAGAALVRQIAHALRKRGFRSMMVWVLKANPARGFYERMGGVLVAEQGIDIGGVALPEVAYGWRDVGTLAPHATE